jgi:hypothetical protein
MRDQLYYNIYSILPSTTITCVIPHYTLQHEMYAKTTVTAKIQKQYSNPIAPGFYVDANILTSSNQETYPVNQTITLKSDTITHVDGMPLDKFAKKQKFTIEGESTVIPRGQGRPKHEVYDLDELEQLLYDHEHQNS